MDVHDSLLLNHVPSHRQRQEFEPRDPSVPPPLHFVPQELYHPSSTTRHSVQQASTGTARSQMGVINKDTHKHQFPSFHQRPAVNIRSVALVVDICVLLGGGGGVGRAKQIPQQRPRRAVGRECDFYGATFSPSHPHSSIGRDITKCS